MRFLPVLLVVAAALPGCFEDPSPTPAGSEDGGTVGSFDASHDAGSPGTLDAGMPTPSDAAAHPSADAASPLSADASATCGYSPSDPHALAKLMVTPIANDADADVRFACLAELLTDQGDRRAPFATLYSMTTTNVRAAIAAGEFQDAAWTAKYLETFAELYRQSFYDYQVGNPGPVPEAWQIAFATAAGKKELVVQDLALGVNAHVDRDLAFALEIVGIGDTPALQLERFSDHTTVNNVLHAELSSALGKIANLYAPGFNEAPAVVLTVLENTFFGALVTGRQNAWDNAESLVGTSGAAHDAVEQTIETEATTAADAILTPDLSPQLMAVLHQLEGT
jgi:hypothetical protein